MGTDIFTHLGKNPNQEQIFDSAMTEMSHGVAERVAEGYDFTNVGCLVDIGGGNGLLVGTIPQKYPRLRGILYDRPTVIAKTPPILKSLNVPDRCELVGGDFLKEVPAGGDAYIVKNVFHNWDEVRVTRMMQNIYQASAPRGLVFVVEYAPDADSPPFTRLIDLCMMAVSEGGRLRSSDEFRALMREAGYELQRRIPLGADGVVLWEALRRGR